MYYVVVAIESIFTFKRFKSKEEDPIYGRITNK
jgi:hypothetical protein